MKKYLIIAAAAALTLASCAKVENFSKVTVGERAISFSNYAPKALVKADTTNYVESTTLIENADFDVWGWYTVNGTSFTGTTEPAYFGNPGTWYTVTYKTGGNADGSANVYPDGARYWPTGTTPDYLHFYAYYPSNAGSITAPSGLGAFTFTAEDAAADQVDFMIADVVKDQTYDEANGNPGTNSGTDGTVALKFRHQLAKIQVKFKTIPDIVKDLTTDIKVDSAKFGNINNTGTLTSSYVPANDSTSTVWSAVSGTAAYDIAVPAANLDSLAANSGKKADDIFLLVPQQMTAPVRDTNPTKDVLSDTGAQFIDIWWTVTTNGVATHNTKRVYLDECKTTDGGNVDADIDWEKNNFVTYIITIAPNQILFTGTANNWDDEAFGYYRVF